MMGRGYICWATLSYFFKVDQLKSLIDRCNLMVIGSASYVRTQVMIHEGFDSSRRTAGSKHFMVANIYQRFWRSVQISIRPA